MEQRKLGLSEIYLKDDRFRISYFFPLDDLVLSIKEIGLVNPPVVTVREGKCILVSGWKRVLACKQLAYASVPVSILEENDDLTAFKTVFFEKMAAADLTLLEKAEAVRKLKRFGEKEENIMRNYLPLLHIQPTGSNLGILMAVSRFKNPVKKFIHEKDVPFSVIRFLVRFSPSARDLLLPLLIPVGQNKQKEILEHFWELSVKNRTSVEAFLDFPEVRAVRDSPEISPLQKSDRIRQWVRTKRYPMLSSWKMKFDAALKKMKWPSDINLEAPRNFEDENILLSFHFKNAEDFKKKLEKLEGLASLDNFQDLFVPPDDE